jgi:serpin B
MQHCLCFVICLLCCSLATADSSTIAVEELVQNHTEFATSLYAIIDSPSNCVVSPYSIATSLAMVFLGARNETADEIQKTLHLTLDRDQLASTTLALAQQLQSTDP